ncbi:hypothetical protein ABIA99_001178 [Bradyrhizobium sp. LB12.1]|uniref:hypothetical protein n=1 Tax=Bradyrhizobium sp. LB12.1 TaxID=3156327 RepID=UPI0033909423
MRVHYEPQSNHIGFDWQSDAHKIEQGMLERKIAILSKLGFYQEFGELDDAAFSGHLVSIELMDELTGILAKTAAIIMDAGFKPTGSLVATIEAVRANPSAIQNCAVEPEALGVMAASYRRNKEPLGQHWYDVTDPAAGRKLSRKQIEDMADRGIADLQMVATKGRRRKVAFDHLAAELGKIYLRFNDKLVRHSVLTASYKVYQADAGPFVDFLDQVLAPLNIFLADLPNQYGERGPLSGGSIARRAIKARSLKRPALPFKTSAASAS